MDWQALWLSLRLGGMTVVILMPIAILVGRWLAVTPIRGKGALEAVLALPLVLPPTVFGFYLLVAFGQTNWVGQTWRVIFGSSLVFSFEGILIASIIVNIPFAVQPVQRAFEAIGPELREAAQSCGLSFWRGLWRIELPLAWPGILTGMVLTFAHTLGEFGVVLMVGGSIPGETKTVAIAIYDRVQAFDDQGAAIMSAVLLVISLATIALTFILTRRLGRRYD
ncbi:molybdate ABC transporter permease subunit [Thalassospira sp.]|uniref:molybdate ABC transporter permease subunit n=1 Tax=Thalassospira sp. TaxID=1912094 RepID=UPI00273308F4|nr:molybdate ABC transporter permease subunit [Thalassospira sp.]MDP2697101.1 molybdate ABC transporter permease subunit [Thalassospira sp.]